MFKSEQIKKDHREGYLSKEETIILLGEQQRKLPGYKRKGKLI